MPKHPNIIIFMPDEMRWDCVGYAGNSVINTPNFDRFADEYAPFSHFFVNHTVCTPSRICMFTGWPPHVNGHRTLWHMLRPHQPNVFKYLKQAGYHVEMWGKNDLLAQESFPDSISHEGQINFDYRKFTANPWPPEHKHFRSFYFGQRPDAASNDTDRQWIDGAIRFLESNPPEPFCLYLPLIFPHCPYWCEEPYFSMHDRDRVPDPMPPRGDAPIHHQEMHRSYGLDRLNAADWRELIATYWGMCSRLDDQFGELRESLERNGFWDEAAVLFFSDHGDYAGDYGLVEKWPSGFEDVLLRVPLTIKLPTNERAAMIPHLCETLDLTPTILDIAGVPLEHDQYGKSLLPLIRGQALDHKDAVFVEGGHHHFERQAVELKWDGLGGTDHVYYQKGRIQTDNPDSVAKAAAIRTTTHKYVRRLRDRDELYDLVADPGEQVNLIDSPDHQSVRLELAGRLTDWFLATGDVVPRDKDPRIGGARSARPAD
ncbi:MAG: sulfatase-like hydrolase/transferase [Chloroflexi bacterium]|nr:sulfatase-like hydrolase/transferase [Chloroflexota bacterium]MDE2702832.1 sulfatase-like hydrolase/transferase [Chloroflexota bacterium]MDE2863280.1 sulfatase-like hydrolase/transferase [Chloroflexota bacterium]MXX66231.1 sulfatase-like hydrolase/transferase [Chloroflexota bacterium]MXY00003.1 sulfatase-like hydrolase/transferase [Chloroflexota bacterium]